MIYHYEGNLFLSDCTAFIHQANCCSRMKSGVAAQIVERYPEAYKADKNSPLTKDEKLGKFTYAKGKDGKYVFNLYGQKEYFPREGQTDYDAFESGFRSILDYTKELEENGEEIKIGLPYKIGSDLAGGLWERVYEIIERVADEKQVDIHIYKYTPQQKK